MQSDALNVGDVVPDEFNDAKVHVQLPVVTSPASPARRRGAWRIIKGIVSTVAGFILAAVALLAIVVAVSTHFSSDGQAGLLSHPVMSVLSGSMAPAINTGDLVVDNKLTPAQAANLHVGQIISFRAAPGSSQIFTHRIAEVEPLPNGVVGYVTKGDANDSRDGPVTPSTNVVGLYESRIP
ncbi:MAG: signal peptidase, partial [Acidimicrobiaceae bacterium]|nr:signal peptidase [Acidimicrobiaceae bacterium]